MLLHFALLFLSHPASNVVTFCVNKDITVLKIQLHSPLLLHLESVITFCGVTFGTLTG